MQSVKIFVKHDNRLKLLKRWCKITTYDYLNNETNYCITVSLLGTGTLSIKGLNHFVSAQPSTGQTIAHKNTEDEISY